MQDRLSQRASLVASLTDAPEPARLDQLASQVEILEVRADLVGTMDVGALRQRFPGRLLYTLRSTAEGGEFSERFADRLPRLREAAAHFDLVDLEAGRDLEPELLSEIPAARRLISWHGPHQRSWELTRRFERMSAVEAGFYKLVPAARTAMEARAPLEFLSDRQRQGQRDDVVSFSSGVAGSWSRLVAPRLGSRLVFGSAGGPSAAAGQPTIAALRGDYNLPELRPAVRLNGVIGAPVAHSLSPRLHNGLYRQLGIEALYVPLHVDEFGSFWLDFVEEDPTAALGLPLRGLSVTAPHKRVALAVAGASSPLAGRIGAANTLVRRRGVWEAEATDAEGVVLPLRAHGLEPRGARAAVVGVGGGGLSAAVGLSLAGADVSLFNRTLPRAQRAGRRLGLTSAASTALDPSRFDIVVNATPLGRNDGEPLPLDVGKLGSDAVVVDMVYRRGAETDLAGAARRRGLTVVDGREILLYQAGMQFRMMTGREFPLEEARQLLEA